MKKYTSLLLALLLACGTMIACEKDEPSETSALVTEASETEASDSQVQTQDDTREGFALRGQKYRYNNNDILILEVENTTDTHSSAAVTVTFYNEAGEAVKTQKKTFSQFPAGYKQSVLFQPRVSFASYTCELSADEYTDAVYLNALALEPYTTEVRSPVKLPLGNGKYENVLYVRFKGEFGPCMTLPEDKSLLVKCDVVVLDNVGEVYKILQANLLFSNTDTVRTESNDIRLFSTMEDAEPTIPDELQGDITLIPTISGFELVNGTVQ